RSPLPGRRDGFVEALDDDNRSLLEGLAIVGVEVTLEDPERIDPVDEHFESLGRRYDLDGACSALGQYLTNALVRRLRTRLRRMADVGSPEGEDVQIEEAERSGRRCRVGGSGRDDGKWSRRRSTAVGRKRDRRRHHGQKDKDPGGSPHLSAP